MNRREIVKIAVVGIIVALLWEFLRHLLPEVQSQSCATLILGIQCYMPLNQLLSWAELAASAWLGWLLFKRIEEKEASSISLFGALFAAGTQLLYVLFNITWVRGSIYLLAFAISFIGAALLFKNNHLSKRNRLIVAIVLAFTILIPLRFLVYLFY